VCLDEERFALAGRALQIVDLGPHAPVLAARAKGNGGADRRAQPQCPGCGLVAYPRLAPAVMGLVRREKELLLARAPRFPKDMYSALAVLSSRERHWSSGLEREVYEEVGIKVRRVRYFASQPWPFPHSLMIAFFAGLLQRRNSRRRNGNRGREVVRREKF